MGRGVSLQVVVPTTYLRPISPGKGRRIVTRKEVEEIKGHFDAVAAGLRTELRAEMGELRDGLRAEISRVRQDLGVEIRQVRQELEADAAETRRHVGVVAEDLRSEIRTVAEGVALANERINQLDLRVDGLTGEMRRGFAGVREHSRGHLLSPLCPSEGGGGAGGPGRRSRHLA
jgi:hypothetical protein